MKNSLLEKLRSPKSGEPLVLYNFESHVEFEKGEENIIEGILLSSISREAYPIANGVPVMLDSMFTRDFFSKHSQKIEQDPILSTLNLDSFPKSEWSFSSQWDYHFNSQLTKTWNWSVEERVQQFMLETGLNPQECKGALILDAGCGNGQLTEGLTRLGATVIGLDYSESVFGAEKRRKSSNVHFIQGDLSKPPFPVNLFDIIISNGVIHHTPNTQYTFNKLAKLVKLNGCFYLWLYRKPERFLRRNFLYPLLDFARFIVSRAPKALQASLVKACAFIQMLWDKVRSQNEKLTWQERVVAAYDGFSPMWRHYHTPIEVSKWFYLNGYSCPVFTHWDNPYGFGLVAKKNPQTGAAGVNFGKTLSENHHRI